MMSGYAWGLLYGGELQEPLQKSNIITLVERNHDDVGVRNDSSRGKEITYGIDGG